jgi:hypothetical protein
LIETAPPSPPYFQWDGNVDFLADCFGTPQLAPILVQWDEWEIIPFIPLIPVEAQIAQIFRGRRSAGTFCFIIWKMWKIRRNRFALCSGFFPGWFRADSGLIPGNSGFGPGYSGFGPGFSGRVPTYR